MSTGASATPSGQQECGDIDLHIARDGTWFYHGSPIGRKEMVCLFASVLWRDGHGTYWLETPAEKARISVEDAPFIAEALYAGTDPEGRQVVSLSTNVDELVTVDDDHPVWVDEDSDTGEPRPYVRVRDNLDARLARPVFYDLVAHGTEERIDGEDMFGLWSNGSFFPLGRMSEAETAETTGTA